MSSSGSVGDLWWMTDRATGLKVPTKVNGMGSRWQARYRDEHGREHAKKFAKKVDAQRWLNEVTASVVTGQYVDPGAGRITFARFYADWSKRQVWVSSTREGSDLSAASVTFGDVPMSSLRRSHFESWVKTMSATLAPTTIKTRFTHVRAAIRGAVADRIIATDPSAGVVLPRPRKAEAAMQIPTVDQVGDFVRSADTAFGTYVALCAFAGLRKGEASAVQVGDVDFLRRTLRVTRQLQRAKASDIEAGKDLVDTASGKMLVRSPKYGSERTVYLPDELVTILSKHVKDHTPEGLPSRWLFTLSGMPLHDNATNYRWRQTRKSAKAEEFRLHDLRHFYASGLIAAGCDVVTVQRALGHATATTTLNTYSHLWPTAEDRTRSAASGLVAQALADDLRTIGEFQ